MWFDADQWEANGYPRALPIDRYAFAVLKERGRMSLRELSQAVWGSDTHRGTAKATMERLRSAGLVVEIHGRWSEAGVDFPMSESTHPPEWIHSGLSESTHERIHSPPCADPLSPLSESAQITEPENRGGKGAEKPPRHNRERERAPAPASAPPRPGVVVVSLEKEKQQQRPPSPPYSIEALRAGAKLPRSFDGWDLLELVREIDTEEPPPESDIEAFDLWLGFAANCALWSKLAGGGAVKSFSAYRTGCARRFRRDLEEARDAMSSAIAQAIDLKKQLSKVAEVEEKRAAVIEAAAVPALPAPKAGDDPKAAPHAWLIASGLPESSRLTSLLASTDHGLDDLARRAETLARQADTDWQRGTARLSDDRPDGWRMAADFHRQRYLTQIKRLVALMPEPQKQEAA